MNDQAVPHTAGDFLRPRRNYAETLFRHKLAILLPLVLCLAAGMALALTAQRSYVSTTSLWTDTALPASSTVQTGTGGNNPSANYQQVLTEMLGTKRFVRGVLQRTPLAGQVANPTSQQARGIMASLSKAVTMAAPGPQILNISVKESTPRLAVSVARAVATEFIAEVDARLASRAQAVMTFDRREVTNAQQAVNTAERALSAYLHSHPSTSGSGLDPRGDQLSASLAAAQTQLGGAQTQYDQALAAATQLDNRSVLSVFDPASAPERTGVLKTLVFAGGGGLLAGVLLSALLLYLLAASDSSLRRVPDVEDLLALSVVGTVGELPSGQSSAGSSL